MRIKEKIIIILLFLFMGCSIPTEPPFEQEFYAPYDFSSDDIQTLYDVKNFCEAKGYNRNYSTVYHEGGFSQNPIIKIKCSMQEDQRSYKSKTR